MEQRNGYAELRSPGRPTITMTSQLAGVESCRGLGADTPSVLRAA
jgi:hypothetical protein